HRNKARELEERVIFGGRSSDLEKIYPACDCLVHPSFYDACSLVVLEALASGIPVITTFSNGASMFVLPEYGVVVEPGDVGTLADAMKSMVEKSGRTHGVLPFDSNHEVFAKLERILKADGV
ncbi:MAG: glycosyltransferase family 4 protein, partial [Desulfomonilia bacterium]|nr:glycosyltransferase family 4 protein [Desulfomonilia bacterium]